MEMVLRLQLHRGMLYREKSLDPQAAIPRIREANSEHLGSETQLGVFLKCRNLTLDPHTEPHMSMQLMLNKCCLKKKKKECLSHSGCMHSWVARPAFVIGLWCQLHEVILKMLSVISPHRLPRLLPFWMITILLLEFHPFKGLVL